MTVLMSNSFKFPYEVMVGEVFFYPFLEPGLLFLCLIDCITYSSN